MSLECSYYNFCVIRGFLKVRFATHKGICRYVQCRITDALCCSIIYENKAIVDVLGFPIASAEKDHEVLFPAAALALKKLLSLKFALKIDLIF